MRLVVHRLCYGAVCTVVAVHTTIMEKLAWCQHGGAHPVPVAPPQAGSPPGRTSGRPPHPSGLGAKIH